MSEQPEALRLAFSIEGGWCRELGRETAAELRRLHYLNEARRNTHEALGLRITVLEQAGRQALEALEYYQSKSSVQMFDAAITALRQTLGDKHDRPR